MEGGGGFFRVWDEGFPSLPKSAEGFEESDADRGGEVEAAGGWKHRNAKAVVWILSEEGLGESFGFATEDQKVAFAEIGVPEGEDGFGGEHPGAGPLPHPVAKMGPRVPDVDVALVPVVHSGAAKGFFIERKPEGSDQMEPRSGGEAKTRDVAGVGWDFGFDQDHMKHAGTVIPLREIAKGIHDFPEKPLSADRRA